MTLQEAPNQHQSGLDLIFAFAPKKHPSRRGISIKNCNMYPNKSFRRQTHTVEAAASEKRNPSWRWGNGKSRKSGRDYVTTARTQSLGFERGQTNWAAIIEENCRSVNPDTEKWMLNAGRSRFSFADLCDAHDIESFLLRSRMAESPMNQIKGWATRWVLWRGSC
jgi:hypothetical protein